jgi:hypothetical protein
LTEDGEARALSAMRAGLARWLADMRAKKAAGPRTASFPQYGWKAGSPSNACPGSAPMPKLLGMYALPPAKGVANERAWLRRNPIPDAQRGRTQLSHVAVNIRNGLNRQDVHRQKSLNRFGANAV